MPVDIEPPRAPDQLDTASIKAASVRGLAITGVAQIIRFAIQFSSTVLLARLLMPADFGLVAMAAPLIAFVYLLAEMGLTQATVQRPSISQNELSFLFWVSLGAAVLTGGIVIIAAPLAGVFYEEPRVVEIVMALGAIVMVGGLHGQHIALLNRSLRFGALAVIDVSSFFAGAVAGISAALLGLSYWSIVIAQATTSLTTLVLAWAFSRWVPSPPRRVDSARGLLGFGGDLTAFNLVNFFARNLDNVLLGKFAGEAALGVYDRAYKLLLFPLSQITAPISKIANPVLSRSLSDPDFYRRTYFRLLDAVLLLTFPVAIFSGINSYGVIYVVLGPQWIAAAPIFAVLAIGALFAPIGNSTSWLFTTQGRTKELRNYGALSSAAFVISFIVGLPWGPIGVASCYIAVGTVQGPLIWWAATRRGPVGTSALFRNLAPYVLAAAPVAVFNAMAASYLPRNLLVLVLTCSGSYLLFVGAMALTTAGRAILAPYWDKSVQTFRTLVARFATRAV